MSKSISLCMCLLVIYTTESVFGQDYVINLSVTENKGGGGTLLDLRNYFQKNSFPINVNATCNIISSVRDFSSYFLLDSREAVLKLRTAVDREVICHRQIVTKAGCKLTLLISCDNMMLAVNVEVKDENDNQPQFPLRHKTISIQENSEVGLELSLPTAVDQDGAANSIVRYSMQDVLKTSNRHAASAYFNVVQKNINQIQIPYLKVTGLIDREEVEKFEFVLVAEDAGRLRGSSSVTVKVIDVNDNSPQWSASTITRKVRECASQGTLVELQAFDRDDPSTVNGQIRYKISDHSQNTALINSVFYIAGNSLYLSSQSLQSLKLANKLNFFITAIDGGGRENDTSVTIEIEDCNDHPPQIQMKSSTASVRENDESTIQITSFTVKDEDKGVNSDFECTMNDTEYFNMIKMHSFKTSRDGKLTMYSIKKLAGKSFDREKVAYYTVMIRCADRGSPVLTGQQQLGISVIDENDNSPLFLSKNVHFSVAENNDVGAAVGRVRALDPDTRDNGRITYRIAGPASDEAHLHFSISPQTGAVEAKTRFDRETRAEYSFTVVASDSGQPARNDSCVVRVNVLDVNDCQPTFQKQYIYQVTESTGKTSIHRSLGVVTATDNDMGDNGTVFYRLRAAVKDVSGGARGMDRLQFEPWRVLRLTRTGQLSVFGVVDRETIGSLQVEIVAYDNGHPSLTGVTTVIVDILDVNDNSPQFVPPSPSSSSRGGRGSSSVLSSRSRIVSVHLNATGGTVLCSVMARDPDKGLNGSVVYSIVGGSSESAPDFPFQVQEDGQLMLMRLLEPRGSSQKGLPERVLVKASDQGRPPRSEMLTLHMRYLQPPTCTTCFLPPSQPQNGKSYNKIWDDRRRQQQQHQGSANPDLKGDYGDPYSDTPDNLVLLYVLAGVLFVVFLIVLLVLLYTYFSGRLGRIQRLSPPATNENQHDKVLNNYAKEFSNNYECELLNPTQNQANLNELHIENISNQKSEKSNYTHLMAMHEAKYTPIHFTGGGSGGSYVLGPDSRRAQSPPPTMGATYEVGAMLASSRCWGGSSGNVAGPAATSGGGPQRQQHHARLAGAHSYAAYLNQFGRDDATDDSGSGVAPPTHPQHTQTQAPQQPQQQHVMAKRMTLPVGEKATYQTLPVPDSQPMGASGSGGASAKKCYVTSSFV